MKTLLTTCFVLLVAYQTLFAQSDYLPKLTPSAFQNSKSSVVDSSTHAVVLFEKGQSDITVDEREHQLRVIHHYAVRIHILDKEGFDEANYVIPLYKFGNSFENVRDVKGFTHRLEGNRIQTNEMAKAAVFTEKISDFVTLTKFTLPAISENCIIDIQYEISSPDIFNYRTWTFQEHLPKIHSEYTAIIPAVYDYNVTLKGPYKLDDQKSALMREHFLLNGRRFDCSKLTYIMREIPAFEEEAHMLASKNYKSAINFELKEYYSPTGAKMSLTKNWKDVDRELLSEKSFGGQINRESNFKQILPRILSSEDNADQKAQKIYEYVKRQIKWNSVYGKHAQYGVKDALERRSGNIGDVNLALISALNSADLEAYPVILSTRENGLPNSLHPVMTDFNYVIACVKVGDKQYFLDASEENLPFGLLPLRCINGNGRIIYSKKSSEWIPMENNIEAMKTYQVFGSVDIDGIFTGEMRLTYRGLDAFHQRNRIKSFASIDSYIEERIDRSGGVRIKDGGVENLDSLQKELVERFTITIDFSSDMQGKYLNFNPVLINRLSSNPFNLEERTYPVDLGSRHLETYYANIRLPDGYSINDQPKNTSLALPEASAQYSYQSELSGNLLNVQQKLALNKAIYEVDEYFHLKELFSRIIQHQKVGYSFIKN